MQHAMNQPPPLPFSARKTEPKIVPPLLQEVRHVPEFSGRTGEFFGIWIVNLILSIVTLGIYSAWAKVRVEKYFYGNTRLAGAVFEYTANPIAILKGRLIAYAVLLLLSISSYFFPLAYLLLVIPIVLGMPAFIVLSLRFRARNSMWRGIRFHFDQSVESAYMPFFLWRLVSSVSMGLLSPLVQQKQQEFVVWGHRYGTKRFRFNADLGHYYRHFLKALFIGAIVTLSLMLVGMLLMPLAFIGRSSADMSESVAQLFIGALLGGVAGIYLSIFVLLACLRVWYTNLLWKNTSIGTHRFESSLRARDVLWIYFSNGVLVLLTLGLAIPWAMIRLARYRAEHFALLALGSLDGFIASADHEEGAAAAELLDALEDSFDTGIDIGI